MKSETAIWRPFWYELDQPLEVGAEDDYDFFHSAPDYVSSEGLPVFYHGNWNDNHLYYTKKKRIISIRHPQLGEIRKIDTHGLVYSLTMLDGRILKVEAEESPGVIENTQESVKDWRIYVELE